MVDTVEPFTVTKRPDTYQAVFVTEDNMHAVAKWCDNAPIWHTGKGVHVGYEGGFASVAYPGMVVLRDKSPLGYNVYRVFKKETFDELYLKVNDRRVRNE